jgi:hypothetical protein
MSEGKNRIMIFGPKHDGGIYVVELRTAGDETLALRKDECHAACVIDVLMFSLRPAQECPRS